MPSKPMIESWLPDAIDAFSHVLPAPNVSYIVVTKSKEQTVINELLEKLAVPTFQELENEWAGLTLPGYNGTAIIIRQYGLRSRKELNNILWHEMGHAFAFEYESGKQLWSAPTPAYMAWAEFIADMICFKVANTNGQPILLRPSLYLMDSFCNGKIRVGSIGHFCSATQFTPVPVETPTPIVKLSEMFREKMKEPKFWSIDQSWLERIMEQLNLLRQ